MSSLPLPPTEAQAHSERLIQHIKDKIQTNGWISFAEFMQAALYEPGLGYYVSGSRKLGEDGDFITAPEISSAFSECLALQCQQIFSTLNNPSILEFGAGSGIMAADILLTLENKHALPESYFILEVSPELQERQYQTFQEKCPQLLSRITWLSELPKAFEGVVLANEVLDAMPVHCFEVHHGKKFERGVVVKENNFAWEARLGANLCWYDSVERDAFFLENGYISEICFAIKPWLENLYSSLKRGVVLLMDYGFPAREYYHPDRNQGTLMCHYRHYAHIDPFIYVGIQDITAHVDFTAVARAADQCGFSILGYTNQANFLISLGILSNTECEALTTTEQYVHAQAIKKLLLPSEMGELFKVIALGKQIQPPLRGFELKNEIKRLS